MNQAQPSLKEATRLVNIFGRAIMAHNNASHQLALKERARAKALAAVEKELALQGMTIKQYLKATE